MVLPDCAEQDKRPLPQQNRRPDAADTSGRTQAHEFSVRYRAGFAKENPTPEANIDTVKDAVREQVALTCYENLPEQCHRHCVAEALEQNAGQRCAAQHL